MENIDNNKDQDKRDNVARFKIDGVGAGKSDPETVGLVEPTLQIEKTVSPSGRIQAGDKLKYQIVVTNNSALEAFDVEIKDAFGVGLGVVSQQVVQQSSSWSRC